MSLPVVLNIHRTPYRKNNMESHFRSYVKEGVTFDLTHFLPLKVDILKTEKEIEV